MHGLFKMYPLFFSTETNEVREVCCDMKVEGTFMRLCGFFSRQQIASVMFSQCVSESVYTARVTFVIFCENGGTTRAAVLHQILPETWRQQSGNHSEDLVGFWQQCYGHHTN
jgi:hypothetical protein